MSQKNGQDAPEVRLVPIDCILIGDRVRRDPGDLDGLAESIRADGLQQPVGVTPGMRLVCGWRRLQALRRLGRAEAPCVVLHHVRDALALARAELAENRHRKEFTPTELVEAGRRIEGLEREAAAGRKASTQARPGEGRVGGKPSESGGGTVPPPAAGGKTRDLVGAALGVSGRTYERAREVADAAAADPGRYGDLPAAMDGSGVGPAHRELRARKATAAGEARPPSELEEIGAAVTALASRVTRFLGGGSEAAARLRQYLSYCGLLDHTGAAIEGAEVRGPAVRFLPLLGVRRVVELAGEPGPARGEKYVRHEYDVASGGFVPPVVLRRRREKAGRRRQPSSGGG
ncbi:MAG: hypothetical protein C0501_30565 [Isosphaera sp.]|nr:hypothetical protein [Isosphaera sp.]